MILKALYDYYERKKGALPQQGFELKEIKFLIVISNEGKFVELQDLRENRKGKIFLLPKSEIRSGKNAWQNASLLWDHYGYVLAHPKDNSEEAMQMAQNQHKTFVEKIKNLDSELKTDEGVKAVLLFYDSDQIDIVKSHPSWEDCKKIPGCNLTFKLDGSNELIPQREAITNYLKSLYNKNFIDDEDSQEFISTCLITGEKSPIARLHTPTPIIGGKSNARLVAFQINSGFDSYGKIKSYNAPVSKKAEASYTTALKHLINSKTNKKIVSDTTILFWSEKQDEEINPEEVFSWVIAAQKVDEDNPDRGVDTIEKFINSIFTGQLSSARSNHFYVLGLSPNAARISVRFWKTPSVENFGKNIKKHFDDFEIIHREYEPKYLSLYEILSSVSIVTNKRDKPNVIFFRGKAYDVIPNLAGQLVEAIIDGSQYPLTLVQQCIIRIRAEASKKDKNGKSIPNVTYPRAAIIKAYLNRFNKIQKHNLKEITMGLDKTITNVGYLLGRLFSVIERAQFVSNNYKEPNAGIRDRFFGSFSSSPISVLPIIEKLYGHHLKKIKNSQKFFETKILEENKKEIFDKLEPLKIPAHLTLQQQALFTIGYYHQKQEMESFKSNKKENQSTNN